MIMRRSLGGWKLRVEGTKWDSENEGGVRIKRRKGKYIQHSAEVTEEGGT
jgi:hypothetical protein